MTKKINAILFSLLALSAICSSMYWICRGDYATDHLIARLILSNPITHKIWLAFIMPLPSFYCSIFSFGTLIYAIAKIINNISSHKEKRSTIGYFVFLIFSLAVHIFHVITFLKTFFVK